MDELTDEQLMLLVQHDHAEAFDILYRRHGRRLLGFLWRACGDRDAAEDLAQEVLLNVFRARASYRPIARFTTWLYTLARHACANRRQRAQRERAKTARFAAARIKLATTAAPGERLDAQELAAALAAGLARLPARQKEVLLLREAAGLAYEEIAEVAGVPMGTVKVELHRARRRLAVLLRGVL